MDFATLRAPRTTTWGTRGRCAASLDFTERVPGRVYIRFDLQRIVARMPKKAYLCIHKRLSADHDAQTHCEFRGVFDHDARQHHELIGCPIRMPMHASTISICSGFKQMEEQGSESSAVLLLRFRSCFFFPPPKAYTFALCFRCLMFFGLCLACVWPVLGCSSLGQN